MRDVTETLLPLLAPGNETDGALSVVTTFVQLLQQGGAAVFESVKRLGGHCACLPSHKSSWEEMEAMIRATVKAVEALCQGNNILLAFSVSCVSFSCFFLSLTRALTNTNNLAHGTPPSIILLARSARDGYTPLNVVDALQVCTSVEAGGRAGNARHHYTKGGRRSYSEA